MKRNAWFIVGCFVVGLRLALVARMVASGSAPAIAFALSESSVAYFTVRGWRVGKVDKSLLGLFVPVFYLIPLMFWANGNPTFLWPLLVVCVGVQMSLRLAMWTRINCASPTFLGLITWWPYDRVRHPLACIESLSAVAFLLTYPSYGNMAVCVVAVWGYAWACLIEERFLLRESDYLDYAHLVRWRYCPGVW